MLEENECIRIVLIEDYITWLIIPNHIEEDHSLHTTMTILHWILLQIEGSKVHITALMVLPRNVTLFSHEFTFDLIADGKHYYMVKSRSYLS